MKTKQDIKERINHILAKIETMKINTELKRKYNSYIIAMQWVLE